VAYLDRQYLLGPDLLVAPVMSFDGEVSFYLPQGRWTSLLTGEVVTGPAWVQQTHGFDSVPLFVREGAVIPVGAVDDRPEYDWADGVELRWFEPAEGQVTTVAIGDVVIELAYRAGEVESRVVEGACERYTVKLSKTLPAAENTA
jgi:alpha-D-xyloside xylohydrolase